MADLVRHATGVDLVDIALRSPSASRFPTRSPGRVSSSRSQSASSPPTRARCHRTRHAHRQPRARAVGRGRRPGRHVPAGRGDDPAGPARRRPARLRHRGGRQNVVALDLAEAAARLLDGRGGGMSCGFDLAHYGEIVAAARTAATGSRTSRAHRRGDGDPAPRRRPVARRGAPHGGARARRRRDRDVLPDDGVRLLQPRLQRKASKAIDAAARARTSSRPARRATRRRRCDDRFDPVVAWHNPDPEYMPRRSPTAGST